MVVVVVAAVGGKARLENKVDAELDAVATESRIAIRLFALAGVYAIIEKMWSWAFSADRMKIPYQTPNPLDLIPKATSGMIL